MNHKHSVVHETLKAEMLTGKYDFALPSEGVLVRRFGVSRPTIQRALRDFEREGMIVKIRRKGSFVVPKENRVSTILVKFPDVAGEDDVKRIMKSFSIVAKKFGYVVKKGEWQ